MTKNGLSEDFFWLSNALESFERLLPVDFRRILWDVHRYSETTSEIFVQTICHLGLDAAHQMESAFAINGGSPHRFDFRHDQENSFVRTRLVLVLVFL